MTMSKSKHELELDTVPKFSYINVYNDYDTNIYYIYVTFNRRQPL